MPLPHGRILLIPPFSYGVYISTLGNLPIGLKGYYRPGDITGLLTHASRSEFSLPRAYVYASRP